MSIEQIVAEAKSNLDKLIPPPDIIPPLPEKPDVIELHSKITVEFPYIEWSIMDSLMAMAMFFGLVLLGWVARIQ